MMAHRALELLCLLVASLSIATCFDHVPSGGPYLHPDIQIAGMAKSGTSQMYKLLATHQGTDSVPKEWCPDDENMQNYALELSAAIRERKAHSGENVQIVSACIEPIRSLAYYRWVKANGAPLPNTPKFIFLMRDPAELLWAGFNFWTNEGDVNQQEPSKWTEKPDNYRTPEYFHDILEAEGRIHGSFILHHNYFHMYYALDAVDELIEAAGSDNVLILNSADLEGPNSDAMIRRLSEWAGLSAEGFDQQILKGRTNSGASLSTRGTQNTLNNNTTGVYEMSGYRPMLHKSRLFIYERARSFCEEAQTKYGINFKRCLRHPVNKLRGGQNTQQNPAPRYLRRRAGEYQL